MRLTYIVDARITDDMETARSGSLPWHLTCAYTGRTEGVMAAAPQLDDMGREEAMVRVSPHRFALISNII